MNSKQMSKYVPEWAERARYIDSKPDWIDFIPHELWEFGDVFFPIPRGKKSNRWAFHMKEKRFSADDEILNAYLEAGSGYGVVCAGDLIVIDIDEKEYASHITDALKESMWQMTGSRSGYHIFYKCTDLDSRIILRVKLPQSHMVSEGIEHSKPSRHIGEVKADPHEYVVGPGSIHPSGNRYGPLKGDSISEIDKEHIEEALSEYIVDEDGSNYDGSHYPQERSSWETSKEDIHKFYRLTTDDVLPWLEAGKNIAHPVHGSTTGQNFRKSDDRDVFMCWRCNYGSSVGCALNANQFLAAEETGMNCDQVRSGWKNNPVLHYKSWRRAYSMDLVNIDFDDLYFGIPNYVLKGYAEERGIDFENSNMWDVLNAFVYEHIYYPP